METKEKKRSMIWIFFVIGAVLSWGIYGPFLHRGQQEMRNPLRSLLCVGLAYAGMAIVVPAVTLIASGGLGEFSRPGTIYSTIGGALGALGAICLIWAFRNGGSPLIVMPLVFGGAPLINVLFSIYSHPPKESPNPMLYVGFALAALGAGMVLYFKPSS